MHRTKPLGLAAILGLVACSGTAYTGSDATSPSPDSATPPDAWVQRDAAASPDAAVQRDAAASPDAAVQHDAANPTDPYDSFRQACVDEINQYRDTLGLPHYARWTDAESCVDGEAQADSEANTAHSAFPSCGEWAQNECPGWGSLESTVTDCLAMMWAEGPGEPFSEHGHYLNMSSTQYTRVACGFYDGPNGVWATQDFQ